MPKVLLLGAGLVAGPAIRYLASKGISVVVAANNPDRAAEILGDSPGEVVDWAVGDEATLKRLVAETDLTISLLPATMHIDVARVCVAAGRSLVTASYANDEMRALDAEAKERGVSLLLELGLDPGIDHMSAMQMIDAAKGRGETVKSFRSYCGGIPSIAANNNPWGYKFSWSPLGVLRATLSSMRYRMAGELVELPPEKLGEARHELKVEGLPLFEAYPNRDSLGYEGIYGIEGVETILRGTLRWPGWVEGVLAFRHLGLLETEPPRGATWPEVLSQRLGAEAGTQGDALATLAAKSLGVAADAPLMGRLAYLGLFETTQKLNATQPTIEALAEVMQQKMVYADGEADLIAMHHELITRRPQGDEAVYTASLIVEGGEAETAMAKTVGVPAAIGARMILDGGVVEPGVQIPITAAIYEPALKELEGEAIVFVEKMETRSAS